MTDVIQDIRAGWMEFEFDLSKESKKVESSSMSVGTEAKAKYNALFWSVGGDIKHNDHVL